MNRKITTSLLFLFLVISSMNAQQDSSSIMGTWKLITLKHGEKEIKIAPEDSIQRLKFITQNSFVWIQYLKRNKIVRNSIGGTYTFNGNIYVENINFVGLGSIESLGASNAFKVKIIEDKMYLSGKLSTGVFVDEIWQRLDKKISNKTLSSIK
jgi:hypothetical protein